MAATCSTVTLPMRARVGAYSTEGRPHQLRRSGTVRTVSVSARNTGKTESFVHSNSSEQQTPQSHQQQQQQQLSRRGACALAVALPLVPSLVAVADEAQPLVDFTDSIDGFKVGIPEGWSAGEGQVGSGEGIAAAATRRALAWFPEDKAKDVNVTLVITNASADFTKLGSFGNAEQFGENLVNQMDRSYLLRAPKWSRKGIEDKDVQIAKLVGGKDLNGGYLIEYTVQNSQVDKKHLLSLVFLGFNGRYNRLYTLTAQCPYDELEQYNKTFLSICKSFKGPAVAA